MPSAYHDPSRAITFGSNPLDRRSEKREDGTVMAEALADSRARVFILSGDRVLVDGDADAAGTHPLGAAALLGAESSELLLLGWLPDGAPRFAARLPGEPEGRGLVDLRMLAAEGTFADEVYGQLAQARSMLFWHQRHGFCAVCGSPTTVALGGYRRDCAACGAQHFPRTDPVAIMLIHDGERALLGRQARFKAGMYSCLAGFVEPGETLEDAVRRETFEEAGISVGRVAFHASQPWPFPSSLMLGCIGEALSHEIQMDESELEDCRWVSRAELGTMLDGSHPQGHSGPQRLAIARHLIDAWLANG